MNEDKPVNLSLIMHAIEEATNELGVTLSGVSTEYDAVADATVVQLYMDSTQQPHMQHVYMLVVSTSMLYSATTDSVKQVVLDGIKKLKEADV